jgi:hypothetical protein
MKIPWDFKKNFKISFKSQFSEVNKQIDVSKPENLKFIRSFYGSDQKILFIEISVNDRLF